MPADSTNAARSQTALCVPVVGDRSPIGTLWLVAQESRTFSGLEIDLAKMAAQNLAGLLARRALQRQNRFLQTNGAFACPRPDESKIQEALPVRPIHLADVSVTPLTEPDEHIVGHWQSDHAGRIHVGMFAAESGTAHANQALTVAKTAAGCLVTHCPEPDRCLAEVNNVIYQTFFGDVELTGWLIRLNPLTGEFVMSGCGSLCCWQTRATGPRLFDPKTSMLGHDPNTEWDRQEGFLPRGEHFVLASPPRAIEELQSVVDDDRMRTAVSAFSRKTPEQCLQQYETQVVHCIPSNPFQPDSVLLISRH